MKSYSSATESFNRVIENSTTPIPVFLQKIHTAFLRKHHKSYNRFLVKLFGECPTMKILVKGLEKALKSYQYFEKEWPVILNIISRQGKELMPYSKTDIQDFKYYRSSSFMSMHFSKVRCA